MNEQKLRGAANSVLRWDWETLRAFPSSPDWADALQYIDDLAHALAAPAGEQVGLTEGGLLAALNDAAKSLATISNLAGKDDFMETMLDVRSYARSRANVAADEVNRHIEAKRNGGAA